jgi:MFS family permease
MIERFRRTYQSFPTSFRALVIAMFVDRLGGTILYPYFALYITRRFGVGMTEAGVLLGLFSVSGLVGGILGGALADKIGRRSIVVFGLVSSALGSLVMGLLDNLVAFYVLAVVVGLLGSIAGPAHQAMVADILPEEQRAEGFAILRVVANLSWILGPTIGGLLATQSYLLLFATDAITSTATALIIYRLIPETKPESIATGPAPSFLQTLAGYSVVLRDRLYVGFLVASMLMLIVYQQMYSTLAVYLRDVHGVPDRGYGLLLSLDALIVVLFQFWVTRRVRGYPPMLMMAAGTALYMIGFTMYGFVASYALFVVAIVIITVGEMIVVPLGQVLASFFAPEDMRGRYMAAFEFSWGIPAMIGPLAAGLVMDNFDPNWVWYASGIICAVAIGGFIWLHALTTTRFRAVQVES